MKAASDVYAPHSGTVHDVNSAIGEDPALVKRAPEADGWFWRMTLTESRAGEAAAIGSMARFVIVLRYPGTTVALHDLRAEIEAAYAAGALAIVAADPLAFVQLTRPAAIGADACHLKLHKTFCIPHGGGSPGVGPIAVASHLVPYLPNHPLREDAGPAAGCGTIAAAPFGSAGVFPISYAYIRLMGGAGLKRASEIAILNAHYVAARLRGHFLLLHASRGGRVAHECMIGCRALQ